MPTFTTIALESLLEPRVRDSYYKNPFNSKPPKSPVDDLCVDDDKEEKNIKEKRAQKTLPSRSHIYILSPSLYVTPQPTPIPHSSSDPLSPSPYVVNHKRRGGDAFSRRLGGFDDETPLYKSHNAESNSISDCCCEVVGVSQGQGDNVVVEGVADDDNFWGAEAEEEIAGRDGRNGGGSVAVADDDDDDDDFFNPLSLSVGSSTEVGDFGKQAESRSYVSNKGEGVFFDANEDFSSDGSSSNFSSYGPRIESELHATRLKLLEEIERRKSAEYAVGQMYSQWRRLGNHLSRTGLTFPTSPNATSTQLEIDSLEQLCQELVVARFVAEAIGRGQARAEAEIDAEAINESKDLEISRLRDRLQYYEAVNREMSQRNQEVMEVARRQRQRKKSQRRWLWGCIGLSVTIGASVVAYSYLPQTSKPHSHMLPSSSDSSDATSVESA